MAKGTYVAKGYNATSKSKAAGLDAKNKVNAANQRKAAQTVITAPSFKVARNRTDT